MSFKFSIKLQSLFYHKKRNDVSKNYGNICGYFNSCLERWGVSVCITLAEGTDCEVVKQNPIVYEKDPGHEIDPVNKVTCPDDEGILYDNLD